MKALLVFFTGLVMATSQANASNDPSFPMTEFHPRFDSIESTISSLFEDTTLKYKTANVMIAIILYMGWVIFSTVLTTPVVAKKRQLVNQHENAQGIFDAIDQWSQRSLYEFNHQ